MHQAAQVLRDNAGKYAKLTAQEMGKPVRDGVVEIQKCALTCDYYADNAERFLAPEPIKTEARKSFVAFQPLGVVPEREIPRHHRPHEQVDAYQGSGQLRRDSEYLPVGGSSNGRGFHRARPHGCANGV
jgi:Aldehyde dehydrogenase family